MISQKVYGSKDVYILCMQEKVRQELNDSHALKLTMELE